MKFVLWNVEHGISIWVVTPNGHNHWIDLGKTDTFSPSQHVYQKHGVRNIDYLIISHPDKDHIEDLPNFIYYFGGPRTLTRNKSLPHKECVGSGEAEYQQKMHYLIQRYNLDTEWASSPENPNINGGIEYKTFSLNSGFFKDRSILSGNNTSVVTFMLYQGFLFICPGDIEPKGWNELWEKYKNEIQQLIGKSVTKFLVAPHHGRESGYSKEMMDIIKPHIVLISDGWGDSTTHSSYYDKPVGFQGKKCLSTKSLGSIACTISNGYCHFIENAEKSLESFSLEANL